MDILTILAIGERLVKISLAAYNAFRQAVADEGADDETLAKLDAAYAKAIQHELDIINGTETP